MFFGGGPFRIASYHILFIIIDSPPLIAAVDVDGRLLAEISEQTSTPVGTAKSQHRSSSVVRNAHTSLHLRVGRTNVERNARKKIPFTCRNYESIRQVTGGPIPLHYDHHHHPRPHWTLGRQYTPLQQHNTQQV